MLALQTVGAAMGNMVAIHNIVAVCAVLGLKNEEGNILKKTFIPTWCTESSWRPWLGFGSLCLNKLKVNQEMLFPKFVGQDHFVDVFK
jgi:L-lactate permease